MVQAPIKHCREEDFLGNVLGLPKVSRRARHYDKESAKITATMRAKLHLSPSALTMGSIVLQMISVVRPYKHRAINGTHSPYWAESGHSWGLFAKVCVQLCKPMGKVTCLCD